MIFYVGFKSHSTLILELA